MHPLSRRQFLGSVAAGAMLPRAGSSCLEHVVVVTMENRSFDHFLGWLPGADGMQDATYPDRDGTPQQTYHLTDYQGCGHPDPDHSYEGGRVEFNNSACDGWLLAGSNDAFSIGYYTDTDLAFLAPAAQYWLTFDRYFAATMAPTFPNRIYQHAAQSDRKTDDILPFSTLPTIWDQLAAAGVSATYYYNDLPILALWGATYLPISQPFDAFLADCLAGTLPSVAFVDPPFQGEDQGTSKDDHPFADIRDGEAFLNQVYTAVTTSPQWPSTALIITYDEWGGFFDHVPPDVADDNDSDFALRGFRVPCLLVAPWAPRSVVSSAVYDHTSILKLIEWRWNLPPLTARDAAANNLADELDFSNPNLDAPVFDVPPGPFGMVCPSSARPATATRWRQLAALARRQGWPV